MVLLLSSSPDESARAVANDAVAGDISTMEARHRIAELILASSIPNQVAARMGVTGQRYVDLVTSLRDMVVRRVLEDEGQGFLRFDVLAASSFEGWLRQTCAAAAPREQSIRPRNMPARTVLEDVTQIPIGGWAERRWLTGVEGSAEDAVLEALHSRQESELVEIARRVYKQREGSLRFATAQAIRAALDLPALCVPSQPADREFVLSVCRADPRAADRSRRSTIESLREGGEPSLVDERLLSLWDDMTVDQMLRLDPYPVAATHILVVGTLEPMPKPSRAVVAAMRRALREAGPRSLEWSSLCQELLEAWLARSCRPVSDFDDTSCEQARARAYRAAERAAAKLPRLVERVCSWPDAPLGASGEELDACIRRMHLRALDAECAQRQGQAGR